MAELNPMPRPDVSIVIPARNEARNLARLLRDIATAMAGYRYEVLLVDDGSTDDTLTVAQQVRTSHPLLRILSHERSAGQSAALRTGVLAARGYLIATLDADGQNPPENLPKLIAPFHDTPWRQRLGLVQGQRVGRQDTGSKRIASGFANHLRAAILKDGVRDSGCGLKVFLRSLYLDLPYFDHLHRFMPAMVLREGFEVETVDVTHAPRTHGHSNYTNWQRGLEGFVDLFAVTWLMGRRRLTQIEEI